MTDMTRREAIRAAGTGAAVLVAGPAAIGSASASDGFGGVFGSELRGEADLFATIRGFVGRMTSRGPTPDTATLADRARNEFVANEQRWLSYGNWLLDEYGGEPVEDATIDVGFEIRRRRWLFSRGATHTTLDVTFDTDAEVVESITWDDGAPDDPDHEVVLVDQAAVDAADELQRFRREWIGTDEDGHELPDGTYLSELAGRYWSLIHTDSDVQNVVEVLLGEVDV